MVDSPQAPGTRIIDRAGDLPAIVVHRARLSVSEGKDAGQEVLLSRTTTRVGTDEACELTLTDEAVSRVHFELRATSEGVLLRDHGSTNGTFVDGYRVREIFLNRNADIRVGNSRLQFALLQEQVEIPLSNKTNFGDLLGHSAPMKAAFAVLERSARTDVTVLIQGESGTGKELAARALHSYSSRKQGPYVVVDCGAMANNLVESHLFGHAKGSFTGAVDAKVGSFEEADKGTLVLDEIGELPLDLQPKLLRAIETREVQRVGEAKPRSIDIRLVASTNRNLEAEVRAGRFREDLFFRLSVITVWMPPLRERKEEIPRLIRHAIQKLGGDPSRDLPKSLMDVVMSHDWPGNVRELRNFVERFMTLSDHDPAGLLGVPARKPGASSANVAMETDLPFHEARRMWTERFEREYLAKLLATHGDNISEVARIAGISRQSCYRLMEKHGLRTES